MKIIIMEAIRQENGVIDLFFEENLGERPSYPNCIDESGEYVAKGRVSKDSKYIHHIDRDDIRYLIYLNGSLLDDGVEELENGLSRYLEEKYS